MIGVFVQVSPLASAYVGYLITESGCWEWTGATAGGYGRLYVGRTLRQAHRVMYERLVGPIPPGLALDHRCRNRACVNPAHLEPVTCAENLWRSPLFLGNKVACPHGHLYTTDNTYRSPRGARYCIECQRQRERCRQRTRRAA